MTDSTYRIWDNVDQCYLTGGEVLSLNIDNREHSNNSKERWKRVHYAKDIIKRAGDPKYYVVPAQLEIHKVREVVEEIIK